MIGELGYAGKTLLSLRRNTSLSRFTAARSAQILVYGVIAAVVILFARIIYSIVFGFTLDASLSPFTGTLAVKVVLIFLVQLIAALFIAVAGFLTRNITRVEYQGTSVEQASEMK
jgi:uncharacterized membrane protein YcfT